MRWWIASSTGETEAHMRLTKHHGLRNDFLVVLDERNDTPIDVGPDMARRLCDRRAGLGADGLIHGAAPPVDSDADVVMHLFNADGGRAEMSGNGIRCLAQAVAIATGRTDGTIVVESDTGRRELEISAGTDAAEMLVSVDLGDVGAGPGVAATDLPVDAKEIGTADLGNPHVVLQLMDSTFAEVDIAAVGPAIESAYDDGINVELIAQGTGHDVLDMLVWERGVGVTEACGTGACAAAHLAHEWGMVGDVVEVRMPGGSVTVELVEGRAILRGPTVVVADLELTEGVVLDG
jgi:diaminopimelate epimerase